MKTSQIIVKAAFEIIKQMKNSNGISRNFQVASKYARHKFFNLTPLEWVEAEQYAKNKLGDYDIFEAIKYKKLINEELKIPINKGSEILYGKFKNKKGIVDSFKWNEKGDLICVLDSGKEIGLLKFRIKPK